MDAVFYFTEYIQHLHYLLMIDATKYLGVFIKLLNQLIVIRDSNSTKLFLR